MLKLPLNFLLLIAFALLLSCNSKNEFILENSSLSRTIIIKEGKIRTVKLVNKISNKELIPQNTIEFKLRISGGTHVEGSDIELTSKDFEFKKVIRDEKSALAFLLKNKKHQLEVEVHYELTEGNFYMNKYLTIHTNRPVTLERIDIETISWKTFTNPIK